MMICRFAVAVLAAALIWSGISLAVAVIPVYEVAFVFGLAGVALLLGYVFPLPIVKRLWPDPHPPQVGGRTSPWFYRPMASPGASRSRRRLWRLHEEEIARARRARDDDLFQAEWDRQHQRPIDWCDHFW